MTTSQLLIEAYDGDELVDLLDVDTLDDVETLLMILLDCPVLLVPHWGDDGPAEALDIQITGESGIRRALLTFPLSAAGLARACDPALSEVSDEALVQRLQRALAGTRVFNLMEDDGQG